VAPEAAQPAVDEKGTQVLIGATLIVVVPSRGATDVAELLPQYTQLGSVVQETQSLYTQTGGGTEPPVVEPVEPVVELEEVEVREVPSALTQIPLTQENVGGEIAAQAISGHAKMWPAQ